MKTKYKLQLTLSPYQYHTLLDIIKGELEYYADAEQDGNVIDIGEQEFLPLDEYVYRIEELQELLRKVEGQENENTAN